MLAAILAPYGGAAALLGLTVVCERALDRHPVHHPTQTEQRTRSAARPTFGEQAPTSGEETRSVFSPASGYRAAKPGLEVFEDQDADGCIAVEGPRTSTARPSGAGSEARRPRKGPWPLPGHPSP